MHYQHEVFQNLIRAVRHEQGLSQKEVADLLRKPQSFVSKYESGERRLDIIELRQICLVLGVSLQEFVVRLEAKLDAQHGT